MAKLSGGVPPLLKKCVVLHNPLKNGFEQFDTHLETAPKIIFRINGIINKVAPHQLVVPFNPLPP
jgi:hypothetical protein